MKRSVFVWNQVRNYSDRVTLAIVSVLITFWTTFRFITNGANFDVVGQVGLVGQWMYGLHDGATLGATNYVLKMPLYALAHLVDFISPHAWLYILALAFNLATFGLFYSLGKRFLATLGVKHFLYWRLGVVWLALIAGRVLWVDYANSRNLEIVGGFAVLYLACTLLQKVSVHRALLLTSVGGLIFFADPLQMYVIGGAILLYAGLGWLNQARHGDLLPKPHAITIVATLAGVILTKALAVIAVTILPVTFLRPPASPKLTGLHNLLPSLEGIGHATLRIFDLDFLAKPLGMVTLRHAIALILLGSMLWLLMKHVHSMRRAGALLLLCVIFTSYVGYIVSGQADQLGTERYIVHVPFTLALLFGLAGNRISPAKARGTVLVWGICALLGAGLLGGALVRAWPQRFAVDAPMVALAKFAQRSPADLIISGRQTAIPANYYVGYEKKVAPVICTSQDEIKLDNLFYDQASWQAINKQGSTVHIVVQPGGLYSEGSACDVQDIVSQLGKPISVGHDAIGTVLAYQASSDLAKKLSE